MEARCQQELPEKLEPKLKEFLAKASAEVVPPGMLEPGMESIQTIGCSAQYDGLYDAIQVVGIVIIMVRQTPEYSTKQSD